MKQIQFIDIENEEVHGGMLLDDDTIVCGCCGGLIEEDEIADLTKGEKIEDGITHAIVKVYDNWVDLDEEILGDDAIDTYEEILESQNKEI